MFWPLNVEFNPGLSADLGLGAVLGETLQHHPSVLKVANHSSADLFTNLSLHQCMACLNDVQ